MDEIGRILLIANYKKKKAEKKQKEREEAAQIKSSMNRHAVNLIKAEKRKEKKRLELYQLSKAKQKKKNKQETRRLRRQRIQHQYYIKHKRRNLRKHKREGDIEGTFVIIIAQDKKQIRALSTFKWRNSAIKRYMELVKENHNQALCPVIMKNKTQRTKYEIILKEKIDPETQGNETQFRDETGSFITVKTDNPEWIITQKNEWNVEETFAVYGYHPKYETKNAQWIIDNLLLNDVSEHNPKRLLIWKTYIVIDGTFDFDFIMAKTPSEASHLYTILYERLNNVKGLFFTGEMSRQYSQTWQMKIQEKTGWPIERIKKGLFG